MTIVAKINSDMSYQVITIKDIFIQRQITLLEETSNVY